MINQYNGNISNMDFTQRANIASLSVKGLDTKPLPEDLFVEIVLIDKSNEILRPVLYQFHSDRAQRNFNNSFDKNAFALLGEVDTINKKKKEIYLTNYRTISYKYLIAASGLRQTVLGDVHDEELSAGVIALWEALRVRSNSFPPLRTTFEFDETPSPLPNVTQKENNAKESINKIAQPKAFFKNTESSTTLSTSDKRLYEFQL